MHSSICFSFQATKCKENILSVLSIHRDDVFEREEEKKEMHTCPKMEIVSSLLTDNNRTVLFLRDFY
jgi:hypothetical protein